LRWYSPESGTSATDDRPAGGAPFRVLSYAAVVLAGSYEECWSVGRFRVGRGDVVLDARFEAHLDRFSHKGARILNLVDTGWCFRKWNVARVANADAIARTAETDPMSASLQMREQLIETARSPDDWPDMLAADLLCDPQLAIGTWVDTHGLAAETVSRGFRKVFGLTPAGFRAEARTRHALDAIVGCAESLASVAHRWGFADQAHMSRATRALTGQAPAYWRRRSIPFKTGVGLPGWIGR
jgi:AraC-like DNA-binding protein